MPGPLAIGGVGGSGTRLVAQVVRALGLRLDGDLNEACDNLWFTLLFKYREVLDLEDYRFRHYHAIFVDAMRGIPARAADADAVRAELMAFDRASLHDRDWLQARWESLFAPTAPVRPGRWGWKEPNTHMVLDRLIALHPSLRYVHVMRNGLDMAYSANQNQLRLWGPRALGERFEDTPRGSLAFWRWAHERVFALAARFPGRVLVVDFDRLCEAPLPELERLLEFVGPVGPVPAPRDLARLVDAPASRGRFRTAGAVEFDPEDVRFVASLGFPVDR